MAVAFDSSAELLQIDNGPSNFFEAPNPLSRPTRHNQRAGPSIPIRVNATARPSAYSFIFESCPTWYLSR